MKAMILAAGRGTRLRPLTDTCPKALVEISGRTLLEITIERLRSNGVSEVIINVHHFADRILDYLEAHADFGMRVEVSREDTLLDTGGGLRQAGWFFTEDPDRLDEPFILHNVDVISTIDLAQMVEFHRERQALATLAVGSEEVSRCLLFDAGDQLCGWRTPQNERILPARTAGAIQALDFSGIHVVSPRLLGRMTQHGVFSIIGAYLDLAASGSEILAFHADRYRWRDVGSPESLVLAQDLIEGG